MSLKRFCDRCRARIEQEQGSPARPLQVQVAVPPGMFAGPGGEAPEEPFVFTATLAADRDVCPTCFVAGLALLSGARELPKDTVAIVEQLAQRMEAPRLSKRPPAAQPQLTIQDIQDAQRANEPTLEPEVLPEPKPVKGPK